MMGELHQLKAMFGVDTIDSPGGGHDGEGDRTKQERVLQKALVTINVLMKSLMHESKSINKALHQNPAQPTEGTVSGSICARSTITTTHQHKMFSDSLHFAAGDTPSKTLLQIHAHTHTKATYMRARASAHTHSLAHTPSDSHT